MERWEKDESLHPRARGDGSGAATRRQPRGAASWGREGVVKGSNDGIEEMVGRGFEEARGWELALGGSRRQEAVNGLRRQNGCSRGKTVRGREEVAAGLKGGVEGGGRPRF